MTMQENTSKSQLFYYRKEVIQINTQSESNFNTRKSSPDIYGRQNSDRISRINKKVDKSSSLKSTTSKIKIFKGDFNNLINKFSESHSPVRTKVVKNISPFLYKIGTSKMPNNSISQSQNIKPNDKQKTPQATSISNITGVSPISGAKIAKRELWWRESVPEKKIVTSGLPKFEVQPKIDDKSNWSPSRSQKKIETHKLEWKAQPVLNTKENINYVPGG